MSTFVAIFRASVIVKLALLGLVVGLGMVGYSALSGPPARSSLTTVEGTVTEAARVTRTRRRTGSTTSLFELKVKAPDGATEWRLTIPTIEVAESEIREVIGRPVRAEIDSERDVYVLRSGSRDILTYENTLERRRLDFRQYYVDGIAAIIASLVALLGGALWTLRALRRAAG